MTFDFFRQSDPSYGAGRFPFGAGRLTNTRAGRFKHLVGFWIRVRNTYYGMSFR